MCHIIYTSFFAFCSLFHFFQSYSFNVKFPRSFFLGVAAISVDIPQFVGGHHLEILLSVRGCSMILRLLLNVYDSAKSVSGSVDISSSVYSTVSNCSESSTVSVTTCASVLASLASSVPTFSGSVVTDDVISRVMRIGSRFRLNWLNCHQDPWLWRLLRLLPLSIW